MAECPNCEFAFQGALIFCKRCQYMFPLDQDVYRIASVVSYPKSGRTWFSHLFYHYTLAHFDSIDLDYGFAYRIELRKRFQRLLLERASDRQYPIVSFNHGGGGGKKSTGKLKNKTASILVRPTVLLTRDPRDVIVSHYHHLRKQGAMASPDLSSFLRNREFGVIRVVRFLNIWSASVRARHPNLRVIRYEDLRADTVRALTEALRFLGVSDVKDAALSHAVREASFDAMQRREQDKTGGVDRDVRRVRRGGTTGRHTEVSERDRAFLDNVVMDNLDECFAGYCK